MPLQRQGLGNPVTVASGDITLTESGVAAQEGDLIIATIAARGNAPFTLPSGGSGGVNAWQTVDQQSAGDTVTTTAGGTASGLMAFCKRGATAPNYTFTRSGGNVGYGRLIVYRPATGETWSYDQGSGETDTANGDPQTAGFTTAEDVELLVMMMAGGDNIAASQYAAASDPVEAQWVEIADTNTTTGADTCLCLAEAFKIIAGATGQFTCNASGNDKNVLIVGAWKTGYQGPVPEKMGTSAATVGTPAANPTTGSFTPPANTLLLALIDSDSENANLLNGGGSVTGGGLTWTQLDFVNDTYGSTLYHGLQIWWAVTGASPSSTTVTFAHGLTGGSAHAISCWAIHGANTSAPFGATGENAHLTDSETFSLDAAPASTSLIMELHGSYDVSAGSSFGILPALGWMGLEEFNNNAGANSVIALQVRFGGTSTTCGAADNFEGSFGETVAADDACMAIAFEIKAAAGGSFTLIQSARLDNTSEIFAGTLAAAALVGQGARLDNVSTLHAGRLDLGLEQTALLGNVSSLFVGALDLTLVALSRFDNTSSLFDVAVLVDRMVTQSARFDNANVLGAHGVDLAVAQAARLEDQDSLFAPQLDLALAEGVRHDNANTLHAGRLDHGLVATARLDNVSSLFVGRIDHTLIAGARLNDADGVFAHTLHLSISQPARLDDANALFAHEVQGAGAQTLTQAARLESANQLNAHRIDLSLGQVGRLDDPDTLFAPEIDLALAQVARLDEAQNFGAHSLDQTLAQSQRFDDADDLFGAVVASGVQLTQGLRLDNAVTLFTGVLHVDLAQGLRLDNAQSFEAHGVVLGLTQAARLDDADQMFTPRLDHGLGSATRLDNTSVLFSGTVAAGFVLTQNARIESANVLWPARVDLTVSFDARLDTANVLFAASVSAAIVLAQGQRLDNFSSLFAAEILGGFAVGVDVAYETLRAWTVANWTATALRFENEVLGPPADASGPQPFVYFEMETNFIFESEIGAGDPQNNVWREEGEALWHVAVPSGTGSRDARAHAEALSTLLKSLVLPNGIHLGDIEIAAGDEWAVEAGGNYWALPVIAEWTRDSWKLGSD